MPRGHLLDSQVREIERAIQSSGLLTRDFVWEERDGEWWTGYADRDLPTLVYKSDDFFFSFEYQPPFTSSDGFLHDPGGHQVYFKPGRETQTEHRRQLSWEKVRDALREWLIYVAREQDIVFPDPEPDPPPDPIPDMVDPAAAPPTTGHQKRERVLGATINGWLEREAARRGRLWAVVGVMAGLALAALALLS